MLSIISSTCCVMVGSSSPPPSAELSPPRRVNKWRKSMPASSSQIIGLESSDLSSSLELLSLFSWRRRRTPMRENYFHGRLCCRVVDADEGCAALFIWLLWLLLLPIIIIIIAEGRELSRMILVTWLFHSSPSLAFCVCVCWVTTCNKNCNNNMVTTWTKM